ncbi:thiolase family protein (plasmid) [Rhodococcus sp. USK10]|uniref:thiolase family protein n=1 Tax=Rhodococcus sp. USK10 TaxID=2789739 RepID=UPI001C5D9E98|nr:thiolase family protein [Rhodococcus sp. USK10]QYB00173.1 thiolase family protein [Rhodococcus sp. USK10]
MREVFVAGAGITPFQKYEPGTGRQVASRIAADVLREAGLTYSDVDGVWGGVALGASPRVVFVAKELGLTGVPVQHVTNASASGLAAVHEAKLAIQSGEHDLVLVLGYDIPDYQTSAEDAIARQGFLPPVALFGLWAAERARQFGTSAQDLAAVAAKNWNFARTNPRALRQAESEVTPESILASRTIAGMLTSKMCTPWGDGAGALVLCTREALSRLAPGTVVAQLAASVLQSEVYGSMHTFEGAVVGPREMTERAAKKAFAAAGIEPSDVDLLQVHDAFANEELEYIELLGFVAPGQADALIHKGAFGPGSRKEFGLHEVSTDGGLIGRGHASGATGIAQIAETLRRFTTHDDSVGVCQLSGAGSVCIVQVLRRIEL